MGFCVLWNTDSGIIGEGYARLFGYKYLPGGRTAYWSDGVVVVRNPSAADGGMAFVAEKGYEYFEGVTKAHEVTTRRRWIFSFGSIEF